MADPSSNITTTTTQADPSLEAAEGQDVERGDNTRLVLPQDGYEWKKYGQKFIKSIGKYRSYFKCQRTGCEAKKRADWSESEPANVRIVYDQGQRQGHNHADSSSSSSGANSYNLVTQVFGAQSTTHGHDNK